MFTCEQFGFAPDGQTAGVSAAALRYANGYSPQRGALTAPLTAGHSLLRCAIWYYRHRRNCFHVADDKSPSAHPWLRYVTVASASGDAYDVHLAGTVQHATYNGGP
jgi:hypothetical protein